MAEDSGIPSIDCDKRSPQEVDEEWRLREKRRTRNIYKLACLYTLVPLGLLAGVTEIMRFVSEEATSQALRVWAKAWTLHFNSGSAGEVALIVLAVALMVYSVKQALVIKRYSLEYVPEVTYLKLFLSSSATAVLGLISYFAGVLNPVVKIEPGLQRTMEAVMLEIFAPFSGLVAVFLGVVLVYLFLDEVHNRLTCRR